MALLPNKERRDRWDRLQETSDLMDTICTHIASGGTLIGLTEVWDIPFGWVSSWLHREPDRSRQYLMALDGRSEWAKQKILSELEALGLSDISGILNGDGTVKELSQWPTGVSKTIASVEISEIFEGTGRDKRVVGHTKRVKFWDKTKSLELLGKNLLLFNDKLDVSITQTIDINAALNDARTRVTRIITQDPLPALDSTHNYADSTVVEEITETPDTKTTTN